MASAVLRKRTTYAASAPRWLPTVHDCGLRETYETLLSDEITQGNKTLIAGRDFDATVRATRTMLLVTFAVALGILLALALARSPRPSGASSPRPARSCVISPIHEPTDRVSAEHGGNPGVVSGPAGLHSRPARRRLGY
jgi:hypothetical protein